MASVTQTIPQFSLGMSEQPDNLKFPGQVTEIVNAIPDVTNGLFKRPGAKRIGADALANVQTVGGDTGSWFHYFRDETEGSYIGQVAPNGQVRVWSCKTGTQMTTAFAISETITITNDGSGYTSPPTVTFTAPQTGLATNRATGVATINDSGQVTGITVTNVGSGYTSAPNITIIPNQNTTPLNQATATCVLDNTYVENYLQTANPENLQFLTINDTTFVNNRDISDYTQDEIDGGGTPAGISANDPRTITTVGQTGLTTAPPDPHYALVELLRTENGRQYGVDVFRTDAVTDVSRATRVKIAFDSLYEGDGSGSCPGIGTEVFSVDGNSAFGGNTNLNNGVNATFTTINSGGLNNRKVQVTLTDHGLQTHDQVAITSTASGFTNQTKVSVTRENSSRFSYITDTDQGDHNAASCTVSNPHVGKTNLIFRLNILGQQGVSPNYNADSAGPDGDNYQCSYQREVVLLHGGEGWKNGDRVRVSLNSANGGGGTNKTESQTTAATYTINVEEVESTQVNATVLTQDDGLIRPEPTPFDAQTAVTADTIIGGIIAELPTGTNGITGKQIGNNIYLSSPQPFTVNIVENDLMRVMQTSVNDVQNLPNQCKHGYIVKVSNALRSEEDDYYLKFEGQNEKDGSGSWTECAKSGITKTLTNMPLVIQRTATNAFTVRRYTYGERKVGDTFTNPMPSFVGKPINKVLFFRNRLAFLAGENVITSQPGTLAEPDFFIETALTVSVSDPVDISAASMFPSDLFDGIEINAGLLVFSTNQQFLLASDDTVFNPDTAKLRSIATFNYNEKMAPISLGTTVAYIDNSGKFSRFNEMANTAREGEPNIIEVSKVVPTLLPQDIDLLTNSRENSIVLIGKTGTDVVFGYKYFQTADKRAQAAWFKWKLNNPLVYHFIVNDEYFFLDSDYYLQSIKLVQTTTDPSIVQDNVDFLLHLDNHTTLSGGNHDPASNITTFTGVGWLNTVTTPNHDLAVIDTNTNPTRVGRYAKPTVSGTTFTLPGKWTDSYVIGYLYPYQVKLPTIYPTKIDGARSTSDVNSSLVLHRLKFHFGKIGLYETTLERVGKKDYKEVYESTELDEYEASDAPYLEEAIKTIPVYEKNTNVEITLASSHPAPATLFALSWEGDYSPRYYRRV